jgi:predicted O-linked N-acetylglucosamine transferase (SPINDLY family)
VSIDPRAERKEIERTIVVSRYWFSVLDSVPGSAFVLRAGPVRASVIDFVAESHGRQVSTC